MLSTLLFILLNKSGNNIVRNIKNGVFSVPNLFQIEKELLEVKDNSLLLEIYLENCQATLALIHNPGRSLPLFLYSVCQIGFFYINLY